MSRARFSACAYFDLLKALWGGHTAALQFMLGILLPIGERKHAIRSRRLQEDEIMTACIATSCTEMVLICLSVGLRRNVLHELAPLQLSKSCFPPRAGEGLLFRKMRLKAMRKCGNVTLNACDKADDAKQSIPKGAINKKYTFSQWILQISRCNKWCKKGGYWPNWRAHEANFS